MNIWELIEKIYNPWFNSVVIIPEKGCMKYIPWHKETESLAELVLKQFQNTLQSIINIYTQKVM